MVTIVNKWYSSLLNASIFFYNSLLPYQIIFFLILTNPNQNLKSLVIELYVGTKDNDLY